MSTRGLSGLAVLGVLALPAGLWAQPTSTGRLSGMVESVDVNAASFVIRLPTSAGVAPRLVTVVTTDATQIRLGNQRVSLAEVLPGDLARVQTAPITSVAADPVIAVSVMLTRPLARAEGVITSVDSTGRFTLRVGPPNSLAPSGPAAPELVITVTNTTKIRVDGAEASFADLYAGLRAVVVHRGGTALSVDAKSPVKVIHGRIVEVQVNAGIVQVQPDGMLPVIYPIQVTSTTRIEVDNRPAGIEDLEAGAEVRVLHVNFVARGIYARSPRPEVVEGRIVALGDASIVVQTGPSPNGEPRTVTVGYTDETLVIVDDEEATPFDLDVGQNVRALVREGIAKSIFATTPVEKITGVISAVDLTAKTLTLTVANSSAGESVVVQISNATRIKLNNEPAQLEDLTPGLRVMVGQRGDDVLFVSATTPPTDPVE